MYGSDIAPLYVCVGRQRYRIMTSHVSTVKAHHPHLFIYLLYPPSERDALIPSVNTESTQYLDANISKTVWVRDLVPIDH